MHTSLWPEAFESLLRTHLSLLSEDSPLTGDLDLFAGGLDSLGTVTLLLDLEREFDVSIPDELLEATAFTTPDRLWSLVVRAKARSGA
jgi:acyl carrier protein